MAQQDVEHVSHAHAAAAADIVDLARRALLCCEPVGADHVAGVGPVALRIEVAAVQHRVLQARLDLRNLLGKAAGGEYLATPWSGVIEAARDDALHGIAAEILNCER